MNLIKKKKSTKAEMADEIKWNDVAQEVVQAMPHLTATMADWVAEWKETFVRLNLPQEREDEYLEACANALAQVFRVGYRSMAT